MTFTDVIDFDEALDELAARGLLPTGLSSAEIANLDVQIRLSSVLSARTTSAAYCQAIKDALGDYLSGTENEATLRAGLQDRLEELGYDAEAGGFPGEQIVPPAEKGSLRDLGSDQRVDLVLNTNLRQLSARAFQRSGQTDAALYSFPAWELLRIWPREVPRGKKRVQGQIVDDPGHDWPSRWEQLGGRFTADGRMIATKDDDIWNQIGSRVHFDDAMDSDVEPFAWGSGYGRREVSREECIDQGVITESDRIAGVPMQEAEARASLAQFDTEFLQAVLGDLDAEIAAGEARLRGLPPAAREVAPALKGGPR